MNKVRNYLILAVLIALAGLLWVRFTGSQEAANEITTEVAVHVGRVTRNTLHAYVTVYGTVEPEPSGKRPAAGASIGPQTPGVIEAVKCFEGDYVEKGQTLLQLESSLQDAAVQKALEAVKYAELNAQRQKKLIGVDGTSQRKLLEAETSLSSARAELASARAEQEWLRITAPFSGTVVRINVRPGEAVDQSTKLLELVDLDRLVVRAGVPGTELDMLEIGQSAEVLPDNSDVIGDCSLNYISSLIDPATGTAEVRIALPAGPNLRPGQFVKAMIISEELEDRLAVPVESVVQDENGSDVIAIVRDNLATLVHVKAGIRDGDLVEIESEGIQAGMTVVTSGAYGLPDGTKIRSLGE